MTAPWIRLPSLRDACWSYSRWWTFRAVRGSVHIAPNVFTFWEQWEATTGTAQAPPFWAVVWPAAILMARWLLANPDRVHQKTVVDVGCGSGLAGIAAMRAGAARAIANDLDAAALSAALLNAQLNGVQLNVCGRDLTAESRAARAADVILVCDLFYEGGPSRRLTQWLERQHQLGTDILIADGKRSFLPEQRLRLMERQSLTTDCELEGTSSRVVSLYQWC